jgi:hypothetical protein
LRSRALRPGRHIFRRLVRHQQSVFATYPAGRNRQIALEQATQHLYLLIPRDYPEHVPGSVDGRKRQRHPAPPAVDSGQGYVLIGDIEHGISGYQRRGVAVRTQTEMHEIKLGRGTRDFAENRGVLIGSGAQVRRLDRHGMNLLCTKRNMLKQAFAQVGQVPLRMPVRSYTLIDLKYLHALPRNILVRQRPQHDPRCVTAADRQCEAATGRDRRSSFCRYDRRRSERDGVCVIKDFELHRTLFPSRLFHVPAEAEAHRRENFVLKVRFTA